MHTLNPIVFWRFVSVVALAINGAFAVSADDLFTHSIFYFVS
ncbi:MAG: hypothetical protein ACI8RD_012271, partial [Bacillariaceae sp.]